MYGSLDLPHWPEVKNSWCDKKYHYMKKKEKKKAELDKEKKKTVQNVVCRSSLRG